MFTMSVKLTNAEVEEAGVDMALPEYLRQVAAKIADGSTGGPVMDGNGNTIGDYSAPRGVAIGSEPPRRLNAGYHTPRGVVGNVQAKRKER